MVVALLAIMATTIGFSLTSPRQHQVQALTHELEDAILRMQRLAIIDEMPYHLLINRDQILLQKQPSPTSVETVISQPVTAHLVAIPTVISADAFGQVASAKIKLSDPARTVLYIDHGHNTISLHYQQTGRNT